MYLHTTVMSGQERVYIFFALTVFVRCLLYTMAINKELKLRQSRSFLQNSFSSFLI